MRIYFLTPQYIQRATHQIFCFPDIMNFLTLSTIYPVTLVALLVPDVSATSYSHIFKNLVYTKTYPNLYSLSILSSSLLVQFR